MIKTFKTITVKMKYPIKHLNDNSDSSDSDKVTVPVNDSKTAGWLSVFVSLKHEIQLIVLRDVPFPMPIHTGTK